MKIRTLPLVLALVLLGCPPSGPADFRTLAEKAYPEGATPDRQALDNLWTALFKLPQWHFLMTAKSAQLKQPAVETIDGQPWLLVYTDLQMLRLYAVANKNVIPDGGAPNTTGTPAAGVTDAGPQFVFAVATQTADGGMLPAIPNPYLAADGSPLFLSMTPDEARAFLATYSAAPISGIRFNEGSRRGWFAPVKAVNDIRDFLKADGKL